jgi:hypothetical protein
MNSAELRPDRADIYREERMSMKYAVCFALLALLEPGVALGDEVTDWNRIMLDALVTPPAVAAPLAARPAAIVMAAVFDAVNGIERRYTPIYVSATAPAGASQRAAAVQAAYASLVRLFPAQVTTFDAQRNLSLSGIASGPAAEDSDSIQRGIEWGQTVADAIWAWRIKDGFSNVQPPFIGGVAPGQWRPTPPAFAPGLGPQLATMTPWIITSPSQFRPAGPNSLTSARYAADLNETESTGSATNSTRTPDQTLYVQFWNSTGPPNFWDPVATRLSAERHLTLPENARLLALVNLALADAVIGCWDAKYAYDYWRPVTAIRLADTDGNPDTTADTSWSPFVPTPPFPEYPSAHSCVSSAAGRILAAHFGENTEFSVTSNGMPTVVRNFSSFTAALDEVKNARVFGGIHFRTACNDGQVLGNAIGDYILGSALLRVNRLGDRQIGH